MARVTIELTEAEDALLAKEGVTAEDLLKRRLAGLDRKEVQDWWDNLTPAQKRTIFETNS